MKSVLNHLPERQQQELAQVRTTLLTEFEAALRKGAGGTSEWRKGGQVLKIILFGSYARNDWVDEPDNGYLSDFDLLIIVSHPKLTDIADYWWEAENRILRDPSVGRIVNIIVHDLAEVNQALGRGEYFWTDIVRDGVMLYELPSHPLAVPKPMTPKDAVEMASAYYESWLPKIQIALEKSEFCIGKNELAESAFDLHQAVEQRLHLLPAGPHLLLPTIPQHQIPPLPRGRRRQTPCGGLAARAAHRQATLRNPEARLCRGPILRPV